VITASVIGSPRYSAASRISFLRITAPISSGGIIRPESLISEQKRRQNVGLVLKVGPSAFKERCEDRYCEVGDWVAYSNFERHPEYVGKHIVYYVSDSNLLAVYSKEDIEVILESIR
jgi:co-chaperonin GroES (HSP10)